MAGSQDPYDVIIAGAGPAGCAAALRACDLKLRTVIVDPGDFPRQSNHLDWVGPAGVALCEQCGLKPDDASAATFAGLGLCSWDFKRRSCVEDAELSGWIVQSGKLEEALWRLAQQRGADTLVVARPAELTLSEDHVAVRLEDGREVCGRLLLVADGPESTTAALARLPLANRSEGVATRVDLVLDGDAGETGFDAIIGTRRAMQLATIMRAHGRVHVSLITRETQVPVEAQFAQLLAAAQAAGAVPAATGAQPTRVLTPAGVALDLDTLVGKRCVLIGESAGFVSAFSGEAIYPCMMSGWMAAEVVGRALAADVLQDELLSFGAAWRGELAEYLRSPNTDLSLLMPLVFDNEQMSKRVARAFLLGRGL